MYPVIPPEMITSTAQLLVCYFTFVAALVTCLFVPRG